MDVTHGWCRCQAGPNEVAATKDLGVQTSEVWRLVKLAGGYKAELETSNTAGRSVLARRNDRNGEFLYGSAQYSTMRKRRELPYFVILVLVTSSGLEPILDTNNGLSYIIISDHVLIPDDQLKASHLVKRRCVDGEVESGLARRINGVQCLLDNRRLEVLAEKGDYDIAVGWPKVSACSICGSRPAGHSRIGGTARILGYDIMQRDDTGPEDCDRLLIAGRRRRCDRGGLETSVQADRRPT